jgi:hypothetical protein
MKIAGIEVNDTNFKLVALECLADSKIKCTLCKECGSGRNVSTTFILKTRAEQEVKK